MILFMNVFITEKRLNHYKRYNLPSFNRFDVFKYTLASLAAIDRWSRIILYVELDVEYSHRWFELVSYVQTLFGKDLVSMHPFRNKNTREWRISWDEVESVDDNLMWFSCNDDHVFVDYDLYMIDQIIRLMKADREQHVTCYYSHWPEWVRVAARLQEQRVGDFVTIRWDVHDAVQIIKKSLFKTWWFDYDFGDKFIARSDHVRDWTHLPVKCYVPLRELARHFDGYSHVMDAANVCPPLTIPPGFFTNEMKVLYCSNDRRDGWVNVNPCNPNYFAATPSGTDCRFMLEDLPLFWQNRIKTVEVAQEIPRADLLANRNDAIFLMTRIPINSWWTKPGDPQPPVSWWQSVMRRKE